MAFLKFLRRAALITLVGLTACSGADFLNGLSSEEGLKAAKDIAYGPEPRQKLDIYIPEGATQATPVVLFIHGGSWQSGSKNDYLFIAEGLTSLGYAAVIADYGLYPEVQYPVFIEDTAQATAWVYRNIATYKLNPENLYLMGHSAGAYNVMMVALNKRYMEQAGGSTQWIKGVVGLAGPYDFLPIKDPNVQRVFASEQDLSKTQPISYARRNAPRMLLLTGLVDSDVQARNSYYLYGALQELGNDVMYKEYAGIGHIPILLELTKSFSNKHEVREDIADFIGRKTPKPAPPQ